MKQLEDNANQATNDKQLQQLSQEITYLQNSLGRKTIEIDDLKKANEVLKQELASKDADLQSATEVKNMAYQEKEDKDKEVSQARESEKQLRDLYCQETAKNQTLVNDLKAKDQEIAGLMKA